MLARAQVRVRAQARRQVATRQPACTSPARKLNRPHTQHPAAPQAQYLGPSMRPLVLTHGVLLAVPVRMLAAESLADTVVVVR